MLLLSPRWTKSHSSVIFIALFKIQGHLHIPLSGQSTTPSPYFCINLRMISVQLKFFSLLVNVAKWLFKNDVNENFIYQSVFFFVVAPVIR